MTPADYAVVLTSGAMTGADATRAPPALVDLAAALDAAGSGAVVAGTPDSAGAGGLVAAVRGDPALSAAVSTVDNVGTTAGRVSTVLALAAGAPGRRRGGTAPAATRSRRPGARRRPRERRPPPAARPDRGRRPGGWRWPRSRARPAAVHRAVAAAPTTPAGRSPCSAARRSRGVATLTAVLGAPRGARAAAALSPAPSPALVGRYDDLAGGRPDAGRGQGAGRAPGGAAGRAGVGRRGQGRRHRRRRGAARRRSPGGAAGWRRVLTTGAGRRDGEPVNLLDLRPGRAGKAVAARPPPRLLGGPPAGWSPGRSARWSRRCRRTWASGSCSATAGPTRSARCSASGWRWCRPGRPGPALLAGVVALTLAGEQVSFTQVIEATPVLRELDRLGRRAA